MRIIDLLNKIANGEEVPKKIYYRCSKYTYDDYMADYKRDIGTNLFTYLFSKERTNCFINDEVEITEDKTFNKRVEEIYNRHIDYIYDREDKKLEKLDQTLNRLDIDDDYYRYIMENRFKINELIDKINKEDK